MFLLSDTTGLSSAVRIQQSRLEDLYDSVSTVAYNDPFGVDCGGANDGAWP